MPLSLPDAVDHSVFEAVRCTGDLAAPPHRGKKWMGATTMLRTFVFVFMLLSMPALAADPIKTDGDKYVVRFENDRVRVLEYNDLPGQKTHQHRHPAFVLYAVTAFQRRIVLPDGKVLIRTFKPGDVMWSEAQTHIGVNIGTTPTKVIMIELKR